jgi:hypothetical protein
MMTMDMYIFPSLSGAGEAGFRAFVLEKLGIYSLLQIITMLDQVVGLS